MPCERKHVEAIDDRVRAVCRRLVSDTPDENWDVTAAIASVQKALAACDESPWRSMESAPKNSDNILLTNGEVVTCGFWLDEGEYAYWADACCDWEGIHPDPTHWMPLPAAPEGKP